jgi:hypothetical protein
MCGNNHTGTYGPLTVSDDLSLLSPWLRLQLHDDVYTEVVKCGPLAGLAIPVPQDQRLGSEPCRVYVRYSTQVGMAAMVSD